MVLSLGLLLIGGTILLFVLVAKKIANPPSPDKQISAPREYRHCGEHELALGDGEVLHSISYDGPVARLRTAAADGSAQIRLVQLCSGEVLGRVTIKQHLPEYP